MMDKLCLKENLDWLREVISMDWYVTVLLKDLDLIDDILFVHPKDMQDGKIDITENDITTNLPYVDGLPYCLRPSLKRNSA